MPLLLEDVHIPPGAEFEVFRKTDKAWQKCIEWFNKDDKDKSKTTKIGRRNRRERFIVSKWPRNPNGPIIQGIPRGKDTGNGCGLWGATLYDFYTVNRLPAVTGYLTTTTGSKLAAWAKEHGELEWAKEQLRQAELEDDPREIPPYDISPFTEFIEEQVFKGKAGKPLKGKQRIEVYPEVSDYSQPWPIKPFSTPTIRLQKKLPKNTLPRVLIVHDPWNVLEVGSYEGYEAMRIGSFKWGSRPDIIRIYERKSSLENCGYEDDLCPEAHLYITPKRLIGRGHHSFVYQVELALPRVMLVKPKICPECPISEERKSHKAENSNLSDSNRSGQTDRIPEGDERLNSMTDDMNVQCGPAYCKHLDRGIRPPSMTRVSVCAKISLQKSRYGEDHEAQLSTEARNYELFPPYMFGHWNGYNILQPLHDPTPVGAVVPQFYGYYVPVKKKNEPCIKGRYMSAILLLEHCGFPIDVRKLSLTDRQECFSLIRRLHLAGFEHNSIYERNFLMQYGPLSAPPWERSSLHPRFRLIDFGRSRKLNKEGFKAIADECSNAQENLECKLY